jgi:hypothetical protein
MYPAADNSGITPPHVGMGPFDFDPEVVFAAFGARFGVLEVPASRRRHVAEIFSDSSVPPIGTDPSQAASGTGYPVYVTLRHDLADGGRVEVATRRRSAIHTDVAEHMWLSLINFRIAAEDRPPGLDRVGWVRDVALKPQPATRGESRVLVDGEEARWQVMVDGELAVCGAEGGGQTLLAAVCPVDLVDQLAIVTLPAA